VRCAHTPLAGVVTRPRLRVRCSVVVVAPVVVYELRGTGTATPTEVCSVKAASWQVSRCWDCAVLA